MTIPAILNDLLDYEEHAKRARAGDPPPTYIWVKRGKKEEAWAICSLLGMIVDGDVEVDGHPLVSTYIFARYQQPLYKPIKYGAKAVTGFHAIGVEARYHLRDLEAYFDQQETDNAHDQSNRTQHRSA